MACPRLLALEQNLLLFLAALILLVRDAASVRPTAEQESSFGVLAGGQFVSKSLLERVAESERKRLERAGVRGADEIIDELLEQSAARDAAQPGEVHAISAAETESVAVSTAVPEAVVSDASPIAATNLMSIAGADGPTHPDHTDRHVTNKLRNALVMRAAAGGMVEQTSTGASSDSQPQDEDESAPTSAPAGPTAPPPMPCDEAAAKVGLHCDLPIRCHNLPNHTDVPEVQIGIQRLLEKCYEYRNTCKAAAHEFLGQAAKRRLLMAKIQVMQSGVSIAKKQYHERVTRLKEKNTSIHLLYEGAMRMNSTVTELRGASVEKLHVTVEDNSTAP